MEELDQFKKGNEIINYHAREFIRTVDSLSSDKLFDGGLPIGPGRGKLSIKLDEEFHEELHMNFSPKHPDHRILNISLHLSKRMKPRKTILVTKDVNLRIKAKSIGLIAQDYQTDRIEDIDTLYTGRRILNHVPEELINCFYETPFEVAGEKIAFEKQPIANEYFIFKNGRKSALGFYDPMSMLIKRIDKINAFGVFPRNAEQTFALHALTNPDIQLVTLSGKAGTGKTLLALAAALHQKRNYRQIFIARPVVPLSNKDLGYLPGDLQSKMDPYMQPLYDNLGVIESHVSKSNSKNKRITQLLDEQKLVISPLAYIRGRSLVNIYFIVDEAQNLTPHEVKTIITRAGENTKIIFTGDIFQIDHPYLDSESNGLSYLIEKMQGQKLYAHINLEKGERSVLSELASNLL